MADNYLEKKYEEFQARKAKEQRLKQIAWKKRMDAYRKKLEAERSGLLSGESAPDSQNISAEGSQSHPKP